MVGRGVELGFAATLPPRAAVEYLRRKGYGVSWDWRDTWQEAHARAFVVAKAAKLDVLSTVREAVESALASGQTRREFARDLEPKLRALGWWGRKTMETPEGEQMEVQLGSPRRLKTIYDTNMRVAYAVGRFRRQQKNTDRRPYWQYDSMNDSRTRPSHRAMDRMVFRHDDPIWNTHYPPNGFNCRCTVRALTARQVESRGLHVHDSSVDGKLVRHEDGLTEYAMEHTAAGLSLTPDPGWNYNPGRTGSPFGPLMGDPDRLGPLVGGQTTWRELGLPPLVAAAVGERAMAPRAANQAEARGRIRREIEAVGGAAPFLMDDGRRRSAIATVPTPVGEVALSEQFVRHVVRRGRGRDRYVAELIPTLADPDEVWLQAVVYDDRKAGRHKIRYMPMYLRSAGGVVTVAWEQRDATVALTFYPVTDSQLNGRRRGYLLYRRP